jgi:hypothetical protein
MLRMYEPDRVIDHVDAAPRGDALYRGGEIFFRVDDDMVRAGLAGNLGFRRRRHRADDFGAADLRDLTQEDAAAAGGGMDQAACSRREREGRGRKVMCREALENNCGGFLESDAIAERHNTLRRGKRVGGIGPSGEDKGDAVAGGDVGNTGPDRLDDSGAFQTQRQRQVALIEAAAELRVEEVDARGLDLNEDLACSG